MKNNLKTKISTYGFWTGLSAAIVLLATSIGKAFGWNINNQLIEDIVMSICGVLVVFGVVTVPPSAKKEEKDQETNTIQKSEDSNQSDK